MFIPLLKEKMSVGELTEIAVHTDLRQPANDVDNVFFAYSALAAYRAITVFGAEFALCRERRGGKLNDDFAVLARADKPAPEKIKQTVNAYERGARVARRNDALAAGNVYRRYIVERVSAFDIAFYRDLGFVLAGYFVYVLFKLAFGVF